MGDFIPEQVVAQVEAEVTHDPVRGTVTLLRSMWNEAVQELKELRAKAESDHLFMQEADRREAECLARIDNLRRDLNHARDFHEGFEHAIHLIVCKGKL